VGAVTGPVSGACPHRSRALLLTARLPPALHEVAAPEEGGEDEAAARRLAAAVFPGLPEQHRALVHDSYRALLRGLRCTQTLLAAVGATPPPPRGAPAWLPTGCLLTVDLRPLPVDDPGVAVAGLRSALMQGGAHAEVGEVELPHGPAVAAVRHRRLAPVPAGTGPAGTGAGQIPLTTCEVLVPVVAHRALLVVLLCCAGGDQVEWGAQLVGEVAAGLELGEVA
jgi:hypothetical protein